eukprot:CAMPEP_0167767886 /NCGR_PEP_ID=MMETSP0110_2-20121227/16323_1 /TAXON_ID=629695 /ORGANISM="Gymnochlora sp., Strain CCMP2014" /LENGTH=169 /DNA_ID=CAMNT_0007656423 /DNA_START=1033 /DNA_END=1542 /DNA_ORIENTATION=-
MAVALFQFSRNPLLLDALQDIAGSSAELPALEVKPSKIVNSLQVYLQLLELNTRLQTMEFEDNTLDSLATMLTLSQNDVDDAIPNLDVAARVFNRYDLNSDQKLDMEELKLLLNDQGLKMPDEEVKEALKILDSKNKDGYVQFGEFLEFWANRLEAPKDEPAPVGEESS